MGVWTSHGPEGGNVTVLASDPISPATLYAGTTGGLFKSSDAGQSWLALDGGLGPISIRGVVIDPTAPSTLYAAGGRVFRSDDRWSTWRAADGGRTTDENAQVGVPTPATLTPPDLSH